MGAFAIQPELNFSTKGASTEYGGSLFNGEADFNLSYIELPILAVFRVGDAFDVHAGPYIGYLVGANFEAEDNFFTTETDLDRDNFKPLDYGIAAGLAFNFDTISLGARYNFGLQEVADSSEAETLLGDAKNSVAQLYISFNVK